MVTNLRVQHTCKCNQGNLNNLNIIIESVIISFYFRKTFLKFAGERALAQMIGYSSNDIALFDKQTGSAFKEMGISHLIQSQVQQ